MPPFDVAGVRRLIVGIDVGGTKTQLIAQDEATSQVLVDVTSASASWSAEPVAGAAHWLDRLLTDTLDGIGSVDAVAVGAQGCDDPPHCRALQSALAQLTGVPTVVTNDAALLVPAAGLRAGVGVIAGTGAIAVGLTEPGDLFFAGGWGWVLGDEGSAPALVREAVRAALKAHDEGRVDELLPALLQAFAVPDAPRLARAVNDDPRVENWVRGTLPVFEAAARGSALALDVIESAGNSLADLVVTLAESGAAVTDVVAAGSVITRQPALFQAFTRAVGRRLPGSTTHLLGVPPVMGAIALARTALSASRTDFAPVRRIS
jgi:N-acetylglucosamine kinase-like BadF-type ATPase